MDSHNDIATGLIEKVLTNDPTENHLLTQDEIDSVIRHQGQQDKIFVCTLEAESLAVTLKKANNENKHDTRYSFYIIVNESSDINSQGHDWTSAKITVDYADVTIAYADSDKPGTSAPPALKNAVSALFHPKNIINLAQDDILTQKSFMERGYLSLYNCFRDIDGLSQIGGWNNEGNNITALIYWIQKIALLSVNFKIDDPNIKNRRDKNQILKFSESQDFEVYQFQTEYIEKKLKPKTTDFPFYMLIKESIAELKKYLDDRENSISHEKGWKKKGYDKRLFQARNFIIALSAARNNEDLKEILNGTFQYPINTGITKYKELLNVDNWSSTLASILSEIEDKIKSRVDIIHNSNSETLYEQAILEFANQGKHLEVSPSEYSWLGNELISKKINRKTPCEYHTLIDELIGKLYLLKNDKKLNEQTRCTDMRLLINHARAAINESLNTIQYKTSDMTFPDEYTYIWNNTLNLDPVKRALKLLEDYVKGGSWGLFCHLHWNRHHASLVKRSIRAFKKLGDKLTIDDIFSHFARQLDCEKTNPGGSLIKRLTYIAMKTDTSFNLCLRNHTDSLDFIISNHKLEKEYNQDTYELI